MRKIVCIIQTEEGLQKAEESVKRLTWEDSAEVTMLGSLSLKGKFYKQVSSPYSELKSLGGEVLVWNENILLQPGSVNQLFRDLRIGSGLISAKFIEFPQKYLVDDIYDPKQTFEVSEEGLVKIDFAFPYMFVCKGSNLKYLNFKHKELFGLSLRRLGYENYLDTEVAVGYE